MMTEFRRFLVYLKRKSDNNNNQVIKFTLLSIILMTILGIVIDSNFSINYITNTIKAIIVIINGLSIFSLIFTQGDKYMNNDRETFRSLYSYRQRINISIISLSILVVLFALFVSQSSVIYTLTASVLFAITLIFLSFVRPTPEEIVKNTYGIEDERDIAHSRELIERNKQFEEMKKKDKENNANKSS